MDLSAVKIESVIQEHLSEKEGSRKHILLFVLETFLKRFFRFLFSFYRRNAKQNTCGRNRDVSGTSSNTASSWRWSTAVECVPAMGNGRNELEAILETSVGNLLSNFSLKRNQIASKKISSAQKVALCLRRRNSQINCTKKASVLRSMPHEPFASWFIWLLLSTVKFQSKNKFFFSFNQRDDVCWRTIYWSWGIFFVNFYLTMNTK